jgi:hypothetical protein
MQLLKPLCVIDVRLPPWDLLDVAGIDERDLEPTCLENLEHGDPVHARGFHRSRGDAGGLQPVGERVQVPTESAEGPDRRGVTVRADGDDVVRRPDIDAGSVRIDRRKRTRRSNDQNYITALQAVLEGPEEKAIAKALATAETFIETRAMAHQFAQAVYVAFADTLRAAIAKTSIMKVCKQFTGNEWKRWRYEDKNHLKTVKGEALGVRGRTSRPTPHASLSIDIAVIDKSAINYITNVEQFYFGRGNYLANNETTGKQFVGWLQDEYISKGLNIKDAATWDEFKTKFAGLVNETSSRKIQQIVSTTMGRIQNMGQTLSLYEAGLKRYQIVGPSTYPICAHCKAMLGRIFEVKVAATRLAQILDKGFEKPSDLPPFLSTKYTADQVAEMSDAELQAAGYETAPFHPECRHRKAAVD